MESTKLKFLIIGAGISGLALAHAFLKINMD